jgi:hypothetical protein
MTGWVGRNSVHVTQNLKTGIATINNGSDGPLEFFSGILLKGPLNSAHLSHFVPYFQAYE